MQARRGRRSGLPSSRRRGLPAEWRRPQPGLIGTENPVGVWPRMRGVLSIPLEEGKDVSDRGLILSRVAANPMGHGDVTSLVESCYSRSNRIANRSSPRRCALRARARRLSFRPSARRTLPLATPRRRRRSVDSLAMRFN